MIKVLQIHPEDWKEFGEKAHLAVFETFQPKENNRIDFALVVEEGERFAGYVTCREHDSETLYWQYGGVFPDARMTSVSFQGYKALVDWCKGRYKRITTLIANDNLAMLKMAMKVGYRINGIRYTRESVLLDHYLEFENEV